MEKKVLFMVDSSKVNAFISALTDKFENKQTNKKDDISGDFNTDSVSYPTVKAVKTYISGLLTGKADSSHTHGSISNDGKIGSSSGKIITTGANGVLQASDSITKSMISDFPSTMAPESHTHGDISNDGKIGSTANKPIITTTGGKLSAGSFGTSQNTFCEGNDSRLSDARTPTAHNQASSTITDTNNYANIGNNNQTQESINSAVNSKLGTLSSLEFIEVVSTLPTAGAETMNKIYVIKSTSGKDDNYDEYITIRSGSNGNYTYAFEKIGSTTLDLTNYVQKETGKGLFSGNYADLTNKPSYTPTVTSNTNGAYKIGSINISGSSVDIYGKDTDTQVSTSDIDNEIEGYLDAITAGLTS